MIADTTNPYVGLRPFEVDESILFFGRSDQTMELLQRLHQHHFVAVVGSSGSGKSSLLRAGIIPSLKAGYLVDDSDHWFIAIMKPGQSPLYNLAESLLMQLNTTTDSAAVTALVQQIAEEGADVIVNLLTPLSKEKNINFFLLVDQFEELFRFAMEQNNAVKRDEAIDFVNIMLELSKQKQVPVYVVLTMRSDFIGDCVQFSGLPEAMNESQYLVPRMNRVQLKSVIESPAKLYGNNVDPTLTSLLLNELNNIKDELPLLQHALMRMWSFEINTDNSGALDLKDYEKIGRIDKALSNHADEAIKDISDDDLLIVKKMFQALTTIDENGRKIRRPVLLSQLKELTGASEERLLDIINLFIKDKRCFLIVARAGDTNDKVIDISHESLIRQWNTLAQWVDEEGSSVSNYRQLAESVNLHQQNKKDFLAGSELQIILDWYNDFKPNAVWANRYETGFDKCIQYLDASVAERTKLQAAERSRKRKQRFLVIAIMVLLLCITVSAVWLAGYFRSLQETADKNAAIAKSNATEALRQKNVADEALDKIDSLQSQLQNINKALADYSQVSQSREEALKDLQNIRKELQSVTNANTAIIKEVKITNANKSNVNNYDVNGYGLTKVFYQNKDRSITGSFYINEKDRSWTEFNNDPYNKGQAKYFKEQARDEWSVYLLASDGGRIQIDLFQKKIYLGNRSELYSITKAEGSSLYKK